MYNSILWALFKVKIAQKEVQQWQVVNQFFRWVLSWMPDVRVLERKSLRGRIVEKLTAGLEAQQ